MSEHMAALFRSLKFPSDCLVSESYYEREKPAMETQGPRNLPNPNDPNLTVRDLLILVRASARKWSRLIDFRLGLNLEQRLERQGASLESQAESRLPEQPAVQLKR